MKLEYFDMLDDVSVLDLSEGVIMAHATVPNQSTVFEGHFPGHPIVPGVLLIETMAQASGSLMLATNNGQQIPLLSKVNQAKLRNFVVPGDQLSVEATLEHEGSGFCVTKAQITHGEKILCSAELTFKIMNWPNEVMRKAIHERLNRIGITFRDL